MTDSEFYDIVFRNCRRNGRTFGESVCAATAAMLWTREYRNTPEAKAYVAACRKMDHEFLYGEVRSDAGGILKGLNKR